MKETKKINMWNFYFMTFLTHVYENVVFWLTDKHSRNECRQVTLRESLLSKERPLAISE